MQKHYVYLPLLTLLISCASGIRYVGSSYNATSRVDVFVDESAIKKEFEIVGKGYVRNQNLTNPERIQNRAVSKAKEKGADAILLKDYYVPALATGLLTSSRKDSSGKTITTNANAAIPIATSTEIVVLFLKYK